MDEFVNQTQFSEMLRVSKEMVSGLKVGRKPGPPFPAPVYAGHATLWRRSDAEAYCFAREQYLRIKHKPGRKPKHEIKM